LEDLGTRAKDPNRKVTRTISLEFRSVSKVYESSGGAERRALSSVSFTVPSRSTCSLVGRSGSGKSTLLHLAAAIDVPTEGEVLIENRDVGSLSERDRTLLRRDRIGLVFQFFYLLPHLTVWENVALPELIAGRKEREFKDRAKELLDRVGLMDRAEDNSEKLSGGEMQRIAICRALLRRPAIVLADEPTGNLDDDTAQSVMQLMLELVSREKGTLLFATHSREIADLADATWSLHSGVLESF
jgi:ABC-type lipoprotein export system ATPase subunit